MKKIIILFLIFGICLSCNKPTETASNKGQELTTADSLTNELNEIYKQGKINGFSVAIANQNEPLYSKGFGFSDINKETEYTKNTIQHIASISKTFVGVSLLKAEELGYLKLDDPINNYLPFHVVNPYHPEVPITLMHLATHTSTITDTKVYMDKAWYLSDNQDLSDLYIKYPDSLEMQILNSYDSRVSMDTFLLNYLSSKGKWYDSTAFLNKMPGELYEYSNVATTLAAYTLAHATKMNFDEFCSKYILDPIGMTSSGWNLNNVDVSKHSKLYTENNEELALYSLVTYPDGGLITSATDMSKYLTELIKGYNGKGTVLNNENYAKLFKAYLTADNFTDRNEGHLYNSSYNSGIYMGITPTGFFGHDGGDMGVSSYMFFNTDTKTGSFLMVNTDLNSESIGEFYAIWDKLLEYEIRLKSAGNIN